MFLVLTLGPTCQVQEQRKRKVTHLKANLEKEYLGK